VLQRVDKRPHVPLITRVSPGVIQRRRRGAALMAKRARSPLGAGTGHRPSAKVAAGSDGHQPFKAGRTQRDLERQRGRAPAEAATKRRRVHEIQGGRHQATPKGGTLSKGALRPSANRIKRPSGKESHEARPPGLPSWAWRG